MNKSIIIANWKMNLALDEQRELALDLKKKLKNIGDQKEVVVCPMFTGLGLVGEALKNNGIKLGAQDVFWEERGAYTGEVSPQNLRELGCQYVIVGHSERRQYLGETDEMVNKKIGACLANNLTPIVCVGETFDQRQEGQTNGVVYLQLVKALENIDLVRGEQVIIAYEPVWVIGSGQAVDPSDAAEIFELVRQTLIDLYPLTVVNNNVRLIYGGAVESENVNDFSRLEQCHGFLVGTSSLDAAEFVNIVKRV